MIEEFRRPQWDGLWDLLNALHANRFAIYYTAAEGDLGFRAGFRSVGDADASMVLALFRFPQRAAPHFDINKRTIGRHVFHGALRQPLFGPKGLSPEARAFTDQLLGVAPQNKAVAELLSRNEPYDHARARQMLAHLLPSSHPHGGLRPGSCAACHLSTWKVRGPLEPGEVVRFPCLAAPA
jgi:hypothetical protein